MNKKIEYVVTCSCGREVRLGLSKREQRDRTLNLSTRMAAGLIEDFHEEHGAVTKRFSDEQPDCGHPFRVTGDVCLNCGAADAEWRPGLLGGEVYDKHLKRWRTVIEQKPDGNVKVKDGDEVGTWLIRDEYEITLEVDEQDTPDAGAEREGKE